MGQIFLSLIFNNKFASDRSKHTIASKLIRGVFPTVTLKYIRYQISAWLKCEQQ